MPRGCEITRSRRHASKRYSHTLQLNLLQLLKSVVKVIGPLLLWDFYVSFERPIPRNGWHFATIDV